MGGGLGGLGGTEDAVRDGEYDADRLNGARFGLKGKLRVTISLRGKWCINIGLRTELNCNVLTNTVRGPMIEVLIPLATILFVCSDRP